MITVGNLGGNLIRRYAMPEGIGYGPKTRGKLRAKAKKRGMSKKAHEMRESKAMERKEKHSEGCS
jgi:hypothetical protein